MTLHHNLLSVHHKPPCDKCAHDAHVKKENAKQEFVRQNIAKAEDHLDQLCPPHVTQSKVLCDPV